MELYLCLPLLTLSIGSVLLLVFDGMFKSKTFNFFLTILILLLSLVSCFVAIQYSFNAHLLDKSALITKGTLTFSGFVYFFDILFIVSALLTLFASREYIKTKFKELNEYYTLIVLATFGMTIISHSNNLVVLFLGIETMSLSFYVLAGYFRLSLESVESAVKYFLLGAFATGFLVYGMALIYGASKSLDFEAIEITLLNGETQITFFIVGITLLYIGLAFKIAAFPFHQWAPDVYSGAPTTVAGFMSTAGKSAAIFALFLVTKNFLHIDNPFVHLPKYISQIQLVLAIISAATMLVGNFIAIVQRNAKRMLAYSSVAHAGYLLMGLVANNPEGWNAIAFYSLSYLLMQLGAFVVLSINEKQDNDFNNFEDLQGYSKKHPFIAATMSIFMLSLAGIPPFAGFFAKYFIFLSAIKAGYLWLTIIAVVSSIISMYYYIGLILTMYFKDEKVELSPNIGFSFVTIILCLIGTLLLGFVPQYILDFTGTLLKQFTF
ncbi:MAG: NADH-quinone oxidoreductase subunit N [Ignavibacteria bacterium]|nr:NADH-quinone oxidoreductase subunit N [Ignavibacteria bacterium]